MVYEIYILIFVMLICTILNSIGHAYKRLSYGIELLHGFMVYP